MMAERIGLEAYLSMASFRSGFNDYVGMIDRMNSRTGSAAGSMASKFNRLGMGVLKVGGMMAGAGVAGATALAGAMGGVIVKSSKMAADMQAQVSGIVAIMDTDLRRAGISSSQAVDMLNDAILDLSIDPNLKVDATQAADAIGMLARNGLGMSEIMGGAARNTVLLANATGAEFSTAADIATDTMALFNVRAEDMGHAVNQISAVVNNSKFDINDFRLALAQGGGVASAFGVELEDFTTTIAGIAPAFASGSDAGTSFKTMLQRLIPTTNPATDAMVKLGLVTKDGLSNAFYDANGNMKSMSDISSILYAATKDLTEEQRALALSTIFGADALRAANEVAKQGEVIYTDQAEAAKALGVEQDELNDIIEGGITRYEALQLTMSKGDAERAAATRVNNLAGVMEILRGVVDAVMLQIGTAFLPMWERVGRTMTDFVTRNGPAIVGFFSGIAQWMAARLPTAIENLTGKLTMAITFFQNFFKGLQFASALGAGAVESAVTGIGLALIRMVPAEYKRTVNDVANGLTEIARVIDGSLSTAVSFAQEHMDEFKGALAGIGIVLAGAAIASGIAATAAAIAALVNPITAVIVAAGVLGAAWAGNWGGIQGHVETAWKSIEPTFNSIKTWLQTELPAAASAVGREFGTMWDNIRAGDFAALRTQLADLGTTITTWATDTATNIATTTAGWATSFTGWVDTTITTLTPELERISGSVTKWITGKVTTFRQSARGWADSFTGWVGQTVPLLTTELEKITSAVGAWIDVKYAQWYSAALGWSESFTAWVGETIPTLKTELASLGLTVANWIGQQTRVLATNLLTWGAEFVNWLGPVSADLLVGLGKFQGKIIEFIVGTLIPGTAMALAGLTVAFFSWITDASGDPRLGDAIRGYASAVVNLITNHIVPAVGDAALEVGRGFVRGLQQAMGREKTGEFSDVGTAVVNAIVSGMGRAMGTLTGKANDLAAGVREAFLGAPWVTTAVAVIGRLKTGFDNARTGLENRAREIANGIKDRFTSVNWWDAGRHILNSIKNALSDLADSIWNKALEIANGIKSKFTSVDWSGVGGAIGSGIVSGLSGWAQALKDKASGMVTDAWDAAMNAIRARSPSRLFMLTGDAMGMGVVKGIERTAPKVIGAVRALIKTAWQKAQDVVEANRYTSGDPFSMVGAFANLSSGLASTIAQEKIGPLDQEMGYLEGRLKQLQTRIEDVRSLGDEGSPLVLKGLLDEQRRVTEQYGELYTKAQAYHDVIARQERSQRNVAHLQKQAELLNLIEENGLDAQAVFGNFNAGSFGVNADPVALMQMTRRVTDALAKQMEAELKLRATTIEQRMEAARLQKEIEKNVDAFKDSQAVFDDVLVTLSGVNDVAGQVFNSQVLGGIADQIEQAGQSAAYFLDMYKQTGDQYFYQKALDFEQKRADLIAKYGEELDRVNQIAKVQEQTGILQGRLDMLKRARALGISLDDMGAINSTAAADLVKLADKIAQAEYEAAKFQERIFWMTSDLKTDFKIGGVAGDAFKQFQAQVLDPLWETMTDINATEGQRMTALFQYRREHHRLVSLDIEQARSGLLERRV